MYVVYLTAGIRFCITSANYYTTTTTTTTTTTMIILICRSNTDREFEPKVGRGCMSGICDVCV